MKLALAMMLLLSTGGAHMTQTQRVALYCNPLSQGLNLVVLTLGLGLAFFGGLEQMDRSAKFFPLQHCVDAIQDDKVAQTQVNKPQAGTAATASAAPAKPSSPRED
jgi:hypothetical protein